MGAILTLSQAHVIAINLRFSQSILGTRNWTLVWLTARIFWYTHHGKTDKPNATVPPPIAQAYSASHLDREQCPSRNRFCPQIVFSTRILFTKHPQCPLSCAPNVPNFKNRT